MTKSENLTNVAGSARFGPGRWIPVIIALLMLFAGTPAPLSADNTYAGYIESLGDKQRRAYRVAAPDGQDEPLPLTAEAFTVPVEVTLPAGLTDSRIESLGQDRSFVIADIPGVIEGAAEGAGLGIQFLKHLERTRLLLHIIDIGQWDSDRIAAEAAQIIHEVGNSSTIARARARSSRSSSWSR